MARPAWWHMKSWHAWLNLALSGEKQPISRGWRRWLQWGGKTRRIILLSLVNSISVLQTCGLWPSEQASSALHFWVSEHMLENVPQSSLKEKYCWTNQNLTSHFMHQDFCLSEGFYSSAKTKKRGMALPVALPHDKFLVLVVGKSWYVKLISLWPIPVS